MEKYVVIRKYELVVILDARKPTEEKEKTIEDVKALVAKHGGKVLNSQVWLEKQKFTSPIKKVTEGSYYLLNIEGQSDMPNHLRDELRLNENVLRFSTIVKDSREETVTA